MYNVFLRNLTIFCASVVFLFSQDVTLTLDGGDLNYNSTSAISGFQFSHNGCVTGAAGGDAASNGFTVSYSSGVVLAFSFTGSTIPEGSGTLVVLDGDVTTDCISNLVFSGSGASDLTAEFSDGENGSDADYIVEVGNNYFAPEHLNIAIGETVEWVWVNGFHNVNGSQDIFPTI